MYLFSSCIAVFSTACALFALSSASSSSCSSFLYAIIACFLITFATVSPASNTCFCSTLLLTNPSARLCSALAKAGDVCAVKSLLKVSACVLYLSFANAVPASNSSLPNACPARALSPLTPHPPFIVRLFL